MDYIDISDFTTDEEFQYLQILQSGGAGKLKNKKSNIIDEIHQKFKELEKLNKLSNMDMKTKGSRTIYTIKKGTEIHKLISSNKRSIDNYKIFYNGMLKKQKKLYSLTHA